MADMIACKVCGAVHEGDPPPPGYISKCRRCNAKLTRTNLYGAHLTAALSLSALILYIPANLLPILQLDMYGATTENTVWQGCVNLYRDGQWGVAVIVFLASIVIPLLKISALLLLAGCAIFGVKRMKKWRATLLLLVDRIGKWAMLDVFVMAILVSLVKLQRLATIVPGRGLVAFTAVVALTLLASASFDPKIIWEDAEEK
jgi:paraquat-inducible protein A